VAGERLATDETASRLYGVAKCSLSDRDPPQDGEGEEAESGVLPDCIEKSDAFGIEVSGTTSAGATSGTGK